MIDFQLGEDLRVDVDGDRGSFIGGSLSVRIPTRRCWRRRSGIVGDSEEERASELPP